MNSSFVVGGGRSVTRAPESPVPGKGRLAEGEATTAASGRPGTRFPYAVDVISAAEAPGAPHALPFASPPHFPHPMPASSNSPLKAQERTSARKEKKADSTKENKFVKCVLYHMIFFLPIANRSECLFFFATTL